MVNAGAECVDQEVVRTDNLITLRQTNDLPAFCCAIIGSLSSTVGCCMIVLMTKIGSADFLVRYAVCGLESPHFRQKGRKKR